MTQYKLHFGGHFGEFLLWNTLWILVAGIGCIFIIPAYIMTFYIPFWNIKYFCEKITIIDKDDIEIIENRNKC